MSGFDKYKAQGALKAAGWVEAPDVGQWEMRPPQALLDTLSKMTFHVYDAQDLQAFVPAPEVGDPP